MGTDEEDERVPQFANALATLEKDKRSRQAFIAIWDPYQDSCRTPMDGADGRAPCTIGYQFLIRPGDVEGRERLEMVYSMRSLNASWNLWNDLYLVTNLFDWFQMQARKREISDLAESGLIHINAGSLHTFEEDKNAGS